VAAYYGRRRSLKSEYQLFSALSISRSSSSKTELNAIVVGSFSEISRYC
jgi:hypothetical protein